MRNGVVMLEIPSGGQHTYPPKINIQMREHPLRVELYGIRDIGKLSELTPTFSMLSLMDLEKILNKLPGTSSRNVNLNGFVYSKRELLEKLIHLKVLLVLKQELLKKRIIQISKYIKEKNWKEVREILQEMRVPKDVEIFILTAIAYKMFENDEKRVKEIVGNVYKDLFTQILVKTAYIPTIKIYGSLKPEMKDSDYIQERILGIIWNTI